MSGHTKTFRRPPLGLATVLLATSLLAGCDDTGSFSFGNVFAPKPEAAEQPVQTGEGAALIERDVEVPEVFSATEPGLWDGRPSLGGVWVAHPDVTDPERVIIRNQSNGQSVVGALFRREREIPGPRLQMSSDAAEALGVLAGAPVDLDVTALRKQAVEDAPPPAEQIIAAPDEIGETALDPIAAAGAAIDTAEPTAIEAAAVAPPAAETPAITSTLPKSTLNKPFIQIGIFSQETNAERTAKQMRGAGLIPTVKRQQAGGKPFWRVIVGPATSSSEQKRLLNTIKDEGFSDAYVVTN